MKIYWKFNQYLPGTQEYLGHTESCRTSNVKTRIYNMERELGRIILVDMTDRAKDNNFVVGTLLDRKNDYCNLLLKS